MYARFGQELYTRETIASASIIAEEMPRLRPADLSVRVAETLVHASDSTRRRVAAKIVQRLTAGAGVLEPDAPGARASEGGARRAAQSPSCGRTRVACFSRLLAGLDDTQSRQDLVYFAAARVDALIGAIARDVLYPYFIEQRIPAPYSEDEFLAANACLLLAPEPIITTGLVADYARRVWRFESDRTVALALRVLRQAGIVLPCPILGERGRVMAWTCAPHGISLAALLWCLYDEFGTEGLTPGWDQICRAGFARTFVIPPAVVASRLLEAERAGYVGFWSVGSMRRVNIKIADPDALSRLLLGHAPGA